MLYLGYFNLTDDDGISIRFKTDLTPHHPKVMQVRALGHIALATANQKRMIKRKFTDVDGVDRLRDDLDSEGEEELDISDEADDVKDAITKKFKSDILSTGKLVKQTLCKYTNKKRILIISSRGITARYRHLLEDLKKLIPHHKTDNKLDDKGDIHAVNEIAEMKSCNHVLYLETRKHRDLFMYMGRTPDGPTAKFHVVNIHTMDELKLTGNSMLGSRAVLNFDAAFDQRPHLQVLKSILIDSFGIPLGHPRSKPFNDRVMSFFVVKSNIWVRNYQIVDRTEKSSESLSIKTTAAKINHSSLVEIGPRFVLVPIRIFAGSLGGATLYANPAFISPNSERSAQRRLKGNRYNDRVLQKFKRREYAEELQVPISDLSNQKVFAEEAEQ